MIIPELGNWVICKSHDSPGKVTRLMLGEGRFTADFGVEPDFSNGEPLFEECTVLFFAIEKIITDKKELSLLERGYAGEIIDEED